MPVRQRLMRLAAPFVVLALGTACAPETGQVIAKQHQPAHSWTALTCTAYNKHGMCTTYTPIRQTEPEQWVLTLRSGDDEGDCPVTWEAFHRCQRGETYPDCAG